MPRLDFYANFNLFVKVKLGEARILIGRGPDCDIQLPDDRVSRHHAFIEKRADAAYWIENLSPNGTRVNATLVKQPTALKSGDRVYIEDYVVIYQPDEALPETFDRRTTVTRMPALKRK